MPRGCASVLCLLLAVLATSVGLSSQTWEIESGPGGTRVGLSGVPILEHSPLAPAVYVGQGEESVTDRHGNFVIKDYLRSRIPLPDVRHDAGNRTLTFSSAVDALEVTVSFSGDEAGFKLVTGPLPAPYNRLWLRLKAEPEERIYGGGEQYSLFNLRGRAYPIWTREQGVGRNKSTLVTFLADTEAGGAGGDYHTTYWPQLSFVSSRRYALTSAAPTRYAVLDLRRPHFLELEFWQAAPPLTLFANASAGELARSLAGWDRRPLALPRWLQDGAIVGLQGGTARVSTLEELIRAHGVQLAAIWIQDWSGKITTSFGSRVFWDWKLNDAWYPGLAAFIAASRRRGVRFLAYINPHLNQRGDLFRHADAQGFLMRSPNGSAYVQDFGEFNVGTVDLTNPAAFAWYKRAVIQENLIGAGFSGWMADFGEYTPADARFHDGSTGAAMHNRLPALWARVNWEAVSELGLQEEVFFFMRAGSVGSAKYCACAWAGDQNVDWSWDDGLASTVPAALSLGLSGGPGLTHFDIGGYTSLVGLVRTPELLLRSAEAAAFTPVMRTHEGNRPPLNAQLYDSPDTLRRFARLVTVFRRLANYTRAVVAENIERGVPAQRPLFLHFPDDAVAHAVDATRRWQYLYGPDLLVAPVLKPGVDSWPAYLPAGERWVHIWTGSEHRGGAYVTVPAALGQPPVFYRRGSRWAPLFAALDNGAAGLTRSASVWLHVLVGAVLTKLAFIS